MRPTEPAAGSTRRDPRALIVAAALLLALRVAVGVWEARHPQAPGDPMGWRPAATAPYEAKQTGRLVLYEFGAAWCGPCQAMNRDVFANEDLAKRIVHEAVPVRLTDRKAEDGHNSAIVDSLQKVFGVDGFPTLVLWSPTTGRHASTSGYGGNPDAVVNWIAASEARVRMPAVFGAIPSSAPASPATAPKPTP